MRQPRLAVAEAFRKTSRAAALAIFKTDIFDQREGALAARYAHLCVAFDRYLDKAAGILVNHEVDLTGLGPKEWLIAANARHVGYAIRKEELVAAFQRRWQQRLEAGGKADEIEKLERTTQEKKNRRKPGPKIKPRTTIVREILAKKPRLPAKAVCRVIDANYGSNERKFPSLARPRFAGKLYDSWEAAYADPKARNLIDSLVSRNRPDTTLAKLN